MYQPRDPSNDFVEFVRVWGGPFHMYCQAVIMYDSRNGKFTVQMGLEIGQVEVIDGKNIQMVSAAGEIITIRRKPGETVGTYSLESTPGKILTKIRTYLPQSNQGTSQIHHLVFDAAI